MGYTHSKTSYSNFYNAVGGLCTQQKRQQLQSMLSILSLPIENASLLQKKDIANQILALDSSCLNNLTVVQLNMVKTFAGYSASQVDVVPEIPIQTQDAFDINLLHSRKVAPMEASTINIRTGFVDSNNGASNIPKLTAPLDTSGLGTSSSPNSVAPSTPATNSPKGSGSNIIPIVGFGLLVIGVLYGGYKLLKR